MQTWEYHCSRTPDFKILGDAGWEFVALREGGECVFKRPAPKAVERFTREQTEHALKGAPPLCEVPRLLNPQLAALARRVGHTQMLIVCDRGFPAPLDLPLGTLDLSVTSDVPTIPQVLSALLPELPHDRVIVAGEMQQRSPERWAWHHAQRAPVEAHPHAMFKQIAKEALACVRTGDSTPYGNVIIVGG
jgi:D-ribose pyranase